MKFRALLLTGAVLPFALIQPGVAEEGVLLPRLILAQADEPCPPGSECPPPQEAAPAEPEQPAPEAAPEQPAPEAPPEQAAPDQPAEQPVEEAAPEQPAEQPVQEAAPEQPAEQPVQEAAPEQPADEPQQAEQPPAEEVPADEPVQEAAPEQPPQQQEQQAEQPAEPAQDQPVQEAAPEQPAEGGAVERAQRRRDELRRRDGEQQEPQQAEQPEQPPAGDQPQQAEQPPADQPAQDQPAQAEAPAAEDNTVEQQLEAQGDVEEANRVRDLREQLLDELRQVVAPQDEAEPEGRDRDRRRGDRDRGDRDGRDRDGRDRDRDRADRGDRDRWDRDRFYDRDEGRGEVVEERGGRIIIDLGGGNLYVQPDVPDEGGRLLYGADDVEVRNLRGGRTETTVYRRNGVQIVTIRDRYGDIVSRTKVLPDGREIVLFDNRYEEDGPRRPIIVNVPPPRIDIPEDRYIVDLGRASDDDIREALTAPPVQQLERAYTLDEVLRNEDIRAYSPRVDLDTITFDFGSATIGNNQMDALYDLGEVMEGIIADNPDEVYLIEGHTDLVGSDNDNLILSDSRAEAVAVALSQNFDIPPENLVTEGYGEQYPKVDTEEPERLNRRVTVRRLTDLMAQN
jgi:outer membrane protein OmpA-like peptidoglycan-associated protein